MKKFSRLISLSAICALAVGLGGCMHAADPLAQYVERSDKNVLSTGDAPSANLAIHTIDPWPKVAANRRIPANGQRMVNAHERYRDVSKQPPQVFIRPATISGGGGGAVQGTK